MDNKVEITPFSVPIPNPNPTRNLACLKYDRTVRYDKTANTTADRIINSTIINEQTITTNEMTAAVCSIC